MRTRFLMNYPENEKISSQVIDFLYAELLSARAMGMKRETHHIWFVSPWISENDFDLSQRGPMADLFPGYTMGKISFSTIIKKFLDYGSTVHIVCKPPHQLINIRSYYQYLTLQRQFRGMEKEFLDLKSLEEGISGLSSAKKAEKEQIQARTDSLFRYIGKFRSNFEKERRKAIGRIDVVELLFGIKSYRPEKVNVTYNSKIHAKVILGKNGAFFGSANLTQNGFNNNDELFAFVTDPATLEDLCISVYRLANVQKTDNGRWKFEQDQYSIEQALQREIEDYKLKQILKADLPEDLRRGLDLLGLASTAKPCTEEKKQESSRKSKSGRTVLEGETINILPLQYGCGDVPQVIVSNHSENEREQSGMVEPLENQNIYGSIHETDACLEKENIQDQVRDDCSSISTIQDIPILTEPGCVQRSTLTDSTQPELTSTPCTDEQPVILIGSIEGTNDYISHSSLETSPLVDHTENGSEVQIPFKPASDRITSTPYIREDEIQPFDLPLPQTREEAESHDDWISDTIARLRQDKNRVSISAKTTQMQISKGNTLREISKRRQKSLEVIALECRELIVRGDKVSPKIFEPFPKEDTLKQIGEICQKLGMLSTAKEIRKQMEHPIPDGDIELAITFLIAQRLCQQTVIAETSSESK